MAIDHERVTSAAPREPRPDRVHLGEELHGRRLLNVLQGYRRIHAGTVWIEDVTGPQHAQTFHAIAELTGPAGTEVRQGGTGPNAKTAKAAATDAALEALQVLELGVNLSMPSNDERRAARARRARARREQLG